MFRHFKQVLSTNKQLFNTAAFIYVTKIGFNFAPVFAHMQSWGDLVEKLRTSKYTIAPPVLTVFLCFSVVHWCLLSQERTQWGPHFWSVGRCSLIQLFRVVATSEPAVTGGGV